jgi:hypothetical protein
MSDAIINPLQGNQSMVIDNRVTQPRQRFSQKAINGIGMSRRYVRTMYDTVNKIMTTYHFDTHALGWIKVITALPSNTVFAAAPLTYNANMVRRYRGNQSNPRPAIQPVQIAARRSVQDGDIQFFGVRDTQLAEDMIPRL